VCSEIGKFTTADPAARAWGRGGGVSGGPQRVYTFIKSVFFELDYFILTGGSILDLWVNSST
jgi:hypothetical protein